PIPSRLSSASPRSSNDDSCHKSQKFVIPRPPRRTGNLLFLSPQEFGDQTMTNWTISSIKSALAAKRISARELAADFFKRIESRNPTLNAYLTLSPERAYAQADKIDTLIAANKPLPPLAGVPIGIKDVLSTRGIRTTCGSKILENHFPAYDATAVQHLEA